MRAVVTGANRGLGLSLAHVLRRRGADVVGTCRRPSDAAELAATGARLVALDLGDEASIDALADAVGPEPIDLLVNNAGIDARAFGVPDGERHVLALSGEHLLGQVRVNSVGPLLVTRALLPALRAAGTATVVDVSSQIGSMALAPRLGRDLGYAVSKAALNMVTIKLAQALRPDGITVVALHPGWVRTDMGGGAADLAPDEAAEAIVTTIAGLSIADTGRFLRWDGTEHPW